MELTRDDLAAEYGDRLWRHRLDVTDTAQLDTVVGKAFAELGRIDVVISNAAAARAGDHSRRRTAVSG